MARSGAVHRGDGAASPLFPDYAADAHGSARSHCRRSLTGVSPVIFVGAA